MYTPHVWIPRLGTNLNRYTKANETANSVDLVNAPEAVSQQGTPFSTDIMNEMEEGITDANAGIGLLATCDTAADTKIKEIDISGYTIKAGMHIDIDFTYGNTVGSVEDGGIASGANIVTKGAGEQIRIVGRNGTFLFNEKIGGEYAGSGCHNAGDCHEMVITTMATGNTADTAGIIKNKDADDIYNVAGISYSYRKQRDGRIEQTINIVRDMTPHDKGNYDITVDLMIPIFVYNAMLTMRTWVGIASSISNGIYTTALSNQITFHNSSTEAHNEWGYFVIVSGI